MDIWVAEILLFWKWLHTLLSLSVYNNGIFLKDFIHFFFFWERESVWLCVCVCVHAPAQAGREAEGEREREKQIPHWTESPTQGLISGPWGHDLNWRQTFNQLSHPGAPLMAFLASIRSRFMPLFILSVFAFRNDILSLGIWIMREFLLVSDPVHTQGVDRQLELHSWTLRDWDEQRWLFWRPSLSMNIQIFWGIGLLSTSACRCCHALGGISNWSHREGSAKTLVFGQSHRRHSNILEHVESQAHHGCLKTNQALASCESQSELVSSVEGRDSPKGPGGKEEIKPQRSFCFHGGKRVTTQSLPFSSLEIHISGA